MGKIINSIAIMSGIILLFYFGGIIENTASTTLLDLVLNPENIESSGLVIAITTATGLVVGILLVLVARGIVTDTYLMIPFITILLSFAWDFIIVFQSLASFSDAARAFSVLLFGPFMIIYTVGVIEWWRGVEV